MKKSLVTLALMGAFAPAFAQSNISVYGVVDAGFESVRSSGVTTNGIVSGGLSDSRVGFKGSEDLGGGLTAKFVVEQGFNVDDGTVAEAGTAFGRQAWVGVSSKSFGEVRVGRQHTLVYDTTYAIDPFAVGLAGNALNVLGYGQYQSRISNAVTYHSPEVAGFQGAVQYGFGETPDSQSDNQKVAFSGSYKFGALQLNAVHSTEKVNTLIDPDSKQTDILVGATYDFKVAKAHFAYGQSKYKDNVAGITDKVNNYLVGVSAPVGSGTVLASYINSDVKDLDQGNSSQFSVGYVHPLSKRTSLYTSYARVSNDDNADLVSGVAGASATKFNVGVNHSF